MDNKHKYLKRFLAFILSAAMVLTYMPMSMLAYAEGENGQPEVVAEEQPATEVQAASSAKAASEGTITGGEPEQKQTEDTEPQLTTEQPEAVTDNQPAQNGELTGGDDAEQQQNAQTPADNIEGATENADPVAEGAGDDNADEPAEIFTVVFLDRNGHETSRKEVAAGNAIGEMPAPEAREGYTAFWTVGVYDTSGGQGEWVPGDKADESYIVNEDLTMVPDYEMINYTVSFYSSETSTEAITTRTVNADSNFAVNNIPDVPQKSGYSGKWVYGDGQEFTNNVSVTGDTRVWADYEQNEFTVTFMVDGAVYQTDSYSAGEELEVPAAPSVGGKTFLGWFIDETEYTGGEAVTSDLTITAKFDTMHTVTFVVLDDAGEPIESMTQFFEKKEGETIGTMPEDPFVEGKVFEKWVVQGTETEVTKDTEVTGDMTVEAAFRKIEVDTITAEYYYIANKGSESGEEIIFDTQIFQVDAADLPYKITAPSSTPTDGDHVDGAPTYYPETPTVTVTADQFADGKCTVRVKYVAYTAKYDFVYYLKDLEGDGYTEIPDSRVSDVEGVMGSNVTATVKDFDYAVLESVETATITQAEGQELKVRYTRKDYNLSYESNGGSYVAGVTVPYGSTVELSSTVPTREGYDFAGWYSDEDLTQQVTGTVTVNADTTLYAKWTGKTVNYTIIYMKEQYHADGNQWVYENSDTGSGTVGTKLYAGSNAVKKIPAPNGYELSSEMNGTATAGGEGEQTEVTIAADGSTVIKVYYSLIRYTLVFNIDRNNGRINIGGNIYSGSNYTIDNVVLGEPIGDRWPASSTEIYSTDRYFDGWKGGPSTYITKQYELVWNHVVNANNNHRMTYTASWDNSSYDRDAYYWLQQPDGTWKIEESYTQIGLNTNNLGAKEIDGYTKHDGDGKRPSADYEDSGNKTFERDVWVEPYDDTYTFNGNGYNVGDTFTRNGHTYTITRRVERSGWHPVNPYSYTAECHESGHYEKQQYQKYVYNFYYDRTQYRITYKDGGTTLKTTDPIFFEADISGSEYNYTPTKPAGKEAYTWGGWYADSAFGQQYTFGTMPGNDLVLYAKWIAPKYTVSFELDGGTPDIASQEVEINQKAEKPANPTKTGYTFEGWFTSADGDERFEWTTPITEDTVIYAHWTLNPLSYTVHYIEEGEAGTSLAPDKTVTNPNFRVGQEITESAVTVAGYRPDAGTKTVKLQLDSANNEITFIYSKKTSETGYVVRYLLDPAESGDEVIKIAEDKIVSGIDGNTLSVIELARSVPADFYTDHPEYEGVEFHPDKAEKELVLGADQEQNVLTFYYSRFKNTKVTVNFVDMDGNPINSPDENHFKAGETFTLSRTPISGWDLNKAVIGTDYSGEAAGTSYKIAGDGTLVFTLFYQKKVTITALSYSKQYDGSALTMPDDLNGQVRAEGLKTGHTLESVQLNYTGNDVTGGRLNAGTATVTPSGAVIKNGSTTVRPDYYKVHYVNGTLTVNKINVTVRIEPDRWTGNTYNGNVYKAGFTNSSKDVEDYIIISNDKYAELYLDDIWETIQSKTTYDGTTPGLHYYAVAEKDAGDYTYTLEFAESDLPVNENFSVNLYVREGRLQILPKAATVTTGSDNKTYDGTPLTKDEATIDGLIDADKSKVTIAATGTITEPGDTENTYEITWGGVNPDNYAITESLGTLTVEPAELKVTVNDDEKIYNGAVQTGFAFPEEVTGTGSDITEDAYTVEGLAAGHVLSIEYEPAAGKDAGSEYEGEFAETYTITDADGKDVTDFYEPATFTAGKLTITRAALTVTVTDQTYTYNGSPQGENSATYTDADEIAGKVTADGLKGDDALTSISLNGQETDAGEYTGKIAASEAAVGTATANYDISYVAGKLTIEKAAVTITAKSENFTYDGNAHSNAGYDVTGLVGSDAVTAVVSGSITFPSESPVTNELASYEFTTGNPDNYEVSTVDGELTMTNASVAITITAASEAWTYDGTAHSNNAVTVTSGQLLTGDTLVATATGSVTNVADTAEGNNQIAEGYKIMHGEEDVTANYVIKAENGTLTINPKAVTVTAQDKAFTYTGEEQSWPEYDVDGLVGNDKITAVVEGSITYPSQSPVANVLKSYEFTTGTPGNYTVTTVDGELTMTNAEVAITITAASQEWTYDGSAHSNSTVTVTSGELLTGDELVATATGSVTNAADTAAGNNPVAAGYKIMHGDEDVTANYAITAVAGKLTINPKAVTVTAQSHEFTYTGEAQTWPKYDVEGLVGDDAISATVTGSITFVDESPVTNTLASYEFTAGTAGNYTVTTANGKLTMKPASVAITITTASQEWTYDGSAHSNNTVTVTSGALLTGDTLSATATGSVTNVADTRHANNTIAPGYKIMHGDKNVTENYVITTVNGTLTINPAPVTITAQDKEFTYTGTAQSWPQYDVTGLVGSDAVTAVVEGSITFPSESPVDNVVRSHEFTSGTAGNYTVSYADGQLTMNNASVAITITAASQEWTYDGSAHSNNGVTVTSGELLTGDTLVATATGSVTNVSDTAEGNNPVASGYKVMHGDEDVTANYAITPAAGKLTIKPATVTITAKSEEFTYDGSAHSNSGYDVTGLVGSDKITAVVAGSITFPSESPVANKVTSHEFTSGTAGNYTVSYADGQLTMKNASVAITITAASQEWTYDGSAHSNNAVTVTSGQLLTGDTLVATATGSVTNAADTAEGNNPVAADYKIMHGEEDVTDSYVITPVAGTLTVNPKAVTITAASEAFIYDGTAHSNGNYTVDGLAGNDAIEAVVTGSITFPTESPVTNVVESYEFTTGTPGNYSVTTRNGQLTMTNAEVAITITAASQTWTYDGDEHSNTGVQVTSGQLLAGDVLVAEAAGKVTNVSDTAAGNNPVKYGYKIMHGTQDVTANYAITAVAGKLTIEPKAVTVTAQDKEFTYTGTAQSWPQYDVSSLVGSDAISATVSGSITFPDESPVTNRLVSYEFTRGTPGNYSVTTANGELTMKNASVAVTITAASQEWIYDGSAHTNNAVTVTSGQLLTGDTLSATATGSVTNVADTAEGNNPVASGYKIMHGEKDVTANYVVTPVDGTLTISKRPLTITANDQTYTYNGSAQGEDNKTYSDGSKVTVSGIQGTDALTSITLNGMETDAGTYPDRIEASAAQIGQATANYEISYVPGTLTINKKPVTVTITGNTGTGTYNGSEQKVEGYTTSISDPLYKETDFAFNGTAEAGGTNAGTYNMGLKASQFTNNNKNFDVTFNVTDGSMVIGRKAVTVTANDSSKTEGGADPTLTATVTGLVGDDTISYDISRTNGETPGTYVISVTGDEIQGNYDVTFVNGTFTIDEAPEPDDDPTPTPGGGGGNPGGGGPAVTPAGPVTPAVVPDEPAPQVEPADIPDDPTPAAPPQNPWALINLICAALATVGAVVALFRKKEEDDEDSDPDDENDNRGRNMAIAKVLGVLAAAASIITFILTEDMSGPMQLTDKWTILMAVLFAAQIGTAIANKKASELDEEEEEEGAEA